MEIYLQSISFGWTRVVLITGPTRETRSGQILGVLVYTEQPLSRGSVTPSFLPSLLMVSLLLTSLRAQ